MTKPGYKQQTTQSINKCWWKHSIKHKRTWKQTYRKLNWSLCAVCTRYTLWKNPESEQMPHATLFASGRHKKELSTKQNLMQIHWLPILCSVPPYITKITHQYPYKKSKYWLPSGPNITQYNTGALPTFWQGLAFDCVNFGLWGEGKLSLMTQ